MSKIKVFISYSHDSEQHKDWVLTFSNTLRQYGIDCQIDQYVNSVEEGWMLWMQQQIEYSDFVLLICTDKYFERLQKRSDNGAGKGVAWEGTLLTRMFYDNFSKNKKFVPVLTDDGNIEQIPSFLRDFPYFFIPSGFESLLRYLTEQPEIPVPPVGKKIPNLPPRDNKTFDISIPQSTDVEQDNKAPISLNSAKSIPYFKLKKKAMLEKRLESLSKRYDAVSNQREATINEGDKISLDMQLKQLEQEIEQVENELRQL